MDQKTCGCFSWFKNMKESLTERWAKFRNIDKKDRKASTYLHRLLAKTNEKALLDQFVNEILSKAQTDIDAEMINMNTALDCISMTSSIISQIADVVVTNSLTAITSNATQSADDNASKTTSE